MQIINVRIHYKGTDWLHLFSKVYGVKISEENQNSIKSLLWNYYFRVSLHQTIY